MDIQKVEETLEYLGKRVESLENKDMLYSIEKRVDNLEKKGSKKAYYKEPKLNKKYWYIDSGGDICQDVWLASERDFNRLSFRNVFTFEYDAKFELERLKVYRELRRYSVCGMEYKNCYSIGIDFEKREFVYIPTKDTDVKQGLLLFKSKEDAKKAIKAVGVDKLFEYYIEFTVW